MIRAALPLLTALLVAAGPVAAQSLHGCDDLDGDHAWASVEGSQGVFYAIDPDLHLFHPLSDGTADRLAELSVALASQGTTLVYVPLPTRSLAMPEFLPPLARDMGFDASLGATLYEDMLDRLGERGVLTVDARAALRAGQGEPLSFFRTDPRLTAEGARRAARAIGEAVAAAPGFEDLPRGRYVTQPAGRAVLPSPMRDALQRHCTMALPEAETETFATARTDAMASGAATSLFAQEAERSPRIALVGTEISGLPEANLPGFLSEFTGLEVLHYSVEDGGSFAAVSSYLTSREFQQQRPAFLVWVNPISNPLTDRGDQPLRELAAAAGGGCYDALPVGRGYEPNVLVADLSPVDPGKAVTLLVDAGAGGARAIRFDFEGPDGTIRSRSVERHPGQVATGRFFMPLSGLWPEGARSVSITLDVPFGPDSRVAACLG